MPPIASRRTARPCRFQVVSTDTSNRTSSRKPLPLETRPPRPRHAVSSSTPDEAPGGAHVVGTCVIAPVGVARRPGSLFPAARPTSAIKAARARHGVDASSELLPRPAVLRACCTVVQPISNRAGTAVMLLPAPADQPRCGQRQRTTAPRIASILRYGRPLAARYDASVHAVRTHFQCTSSSNAPQHRRRQRRRTNSRPIDPTDSAASGNSAARKKVRGEQQQCQRRQDQAERACHRGASYARSHIRSEPRSIAVRIMSSSGTARVRSVITGSRSRPSSSPSSGGGGAALPVESPDSSRHALQLASAAGSPRQGSRPAPYRCVPCPSAARPRRRRASSACRSESRT